jgi:hypothetical protein
MNEFNQFQIQLRQFCNNHAGPHRRVASVSEAVSGTKAFCVSS